MLDLLEHLQDFHAKHHVRTSNAALMPIANPKETKPSVFVKKDGLSFLLTFRKVALTSTSVTNLMVHPECVESMLNVQILMALLNVTVLLAFQVTRINNVLTSTSVHAAMLVVKTQSVKTHKDRLLASALKVQLLTQTQLCDALPSYLAMSTKIALEMQYAILTSVAFVQNQTLETIVAIHAKI